jgi:hypothetical protein
VIENLSVHVQTETSEPPLNLSNIHLPPSAKELQGCSKPEYFHCKLFRCGKRPERPLNHREKSQQCRFRYNLYCPSSPYLLCQNRQAGARALEATLQAQHDETEHGRTSPTGDNQAGLKPAGLKKAKRLPGHALRRSTHHVTTASNTPTAKH